MAAWMRGGSGSICISCPRVRSCWSAMRMRTIDHAACPNATPVSTLAEHALRMERFAALIDTLIYTRSRNRKLKLIADYLRTTPDPTRGWALAALTGGLAFPAVKGSKIGRTSCRDRVCEPMESSGV